MVFNNEAEVIIVALASKTIVSSRPITSLETMGSSVYPINPDN